VEDERSKRREGRTVRKSSTETARRALVYPTSNAVYGILNEHRLLAKWLRFFQLESQLVREGYRPVWSHAHSTKHLALSNPAHVPCRLAFRMATAKDDAQINDAFAVMHHAAKGKAKAITQREQVIDLPWYVCD